MKRKRHYIIPFFFLLLTLAPLLFMGGLQAFQYYIKLRMASSLETETLTLIKLPAAEVKWYEEGREIMVQGKMFDIKTFSITNGIFTAVGIFDEDETEVVNLLNRHWSDQQQTHIVIQLLLLSHCVLLLVFCSFSLHPITNIHQKSSLFSLRYLSPFLSIHLPPPKSFLFLSC